MSQLETGIVQQSLDTQHEAARHPLRSRIAAAVAVGALSLSLAACENPFSDQDDIVQVDKSFSDTAAKTAEINHDPSFRASTVTILDGPFLIGSGSLVKNQDGSYALATIEHVARSLYGLKDTVEESGPFAAQPPKKARQPLYNVPGIGALNVTAEQPKILRGPSAEDKDGYTIIPIDSGQQHRIAEAEKDGTLHVPEKVLLEGKFGDAVTMPLGETGQSVPFVFLYKNQDSTKATLVPLYVLNQDLDYAKGMATLNQHLQQTVNQYPDSQQGVHDRNIIDVALIDLDSSVLKRAKSKELDPMEAAKSLPCMGDSGSPFLNKDGNIIGTLSSGEQFYLPGKAYTDFDAAVINRDSERPMLSRQCLSSVTISSPAH
jgi:hypothetical protein